MEVQDWDCTEFDKPYNGMQKADSRKGRANTTPEKVASKGHKNQFVCQDPIPCSHGRESIEKQDKAVNGRVGGGQSSPWHSSQWQVGVLKRRRDKNRGGNKSTRIEEHEAQEQKAKQEEKEEKWKSCLHLSMSSVRGSLNSAVHLQQALQMP